MTSCPMNKMVFEKVVVPQIIFCHLILLLIQERKIDCQHTVHLSILRKHTILLIDIYFGKDCMMLVYVARCYLLLNLYTHLLCHMLELILLKQSGLTSSVVYVKGVYYLPCFFNLFINDLTVYLKSFGLGINIDNEKLCILLYADDIVILTDNADELQIFLNALNDWCSLNDMTVNPSNSILFTFAQMLFNLRI